MSSSSTARDGAYMVQIAPPAAIEQDIVAMEKLLYALACDEPFSLELVGEVHRQYFLLRANSETMLESLCQQVQAHYPRHRSNRYARRRTRSS